MLMVKKYDCNCIKVHFHSHTVFFPPHSLDCGWHRHRWPPAKGASLCLATGKKSKWSQLDRFYQWTFGTCWGRPSSWTSVSAVWHCDDRPRECGQRNGTLQGAAPVWPQKSRECFTCCLTAAEVWRHLLTSDFSLLSVEQDALEAAMKVGLWGHALLLASKMDSRTHARVMTR